MPTEAIGKFISKMFARNPGESLWRARIIEDQDEAFQRDEVQG